MHELDGSSEYKAILKQIDKAGFRAFMQDIATACGQRAAFIESVKRDTGIDAILWRKTADRLVSLAGASEIG